MRNRLASRGGSPGPVGVSPGANLLVKLDLVGVSPRLQKIRLQSDRRDQQADDSTNKVGRRDSREQIRTKQTERSSWAHTHTHDVEARPTEAQNEPSGRSRPCQDVRRAAVNSQALYRDGAAQPACTGGGQGRANEAHERSRRAIKEERRAPPGARGHSRARRCTT